MTSDLDGLRETLQAPSDFNPRSLDLDSIMREGGRLRRRRRAAVGAGVAAGALILIAGVGGLTGVIGSKPTVVPAAPTTTGPRASAPAIVLPKGAQGALVQTGLPAEKGAQWVIFGEKYHDKYIPSIEFALVLGELRSDGSIETALETSAVEGTGYEAGFHAVEHSYGLETGATQPAFGYFSGPTPARISGTVKGKEITARQVSWSHDPRITIYWFDSSQVTGTTRLSKVFAYDASGAQLPHGTAKVYYE